MNIKSLSLLVVLISSTLLFSKPLSAQSDYISLQVFYDELSPYGEWVNYPQYGYVWIPDTGIDFVPYSTNGQWVMTDYGWTWVSNYVWGWAPFHYGRWDYDNFYGWLWVPDIEWGPSWVIWRRADGYYGWQPMRPGLSINLSFGQHYNSQHDHWIFVRERDFERSNINRYDINRTEFDRIIRKSTVINQTYIDRKRNTTYVSGPAREDVQRVTGNRIRSISIQENNRPGQNLMDGKLLIYRPIINRGSVNNSRPTPLRISNLNDVKQPSERRSTIQNPKVNSMESQKRQPVNVSPPVMRERIQPGRSPDEIIPAKKQGRQPVNSTPQRNNRERSLPVKNQNNNPPANSRETKQEVVKPVENNNNSTPRESNPEKSKRRTN